MNGSNESLVVSSRIIHCVPTIKIRPPSVSLLFLQKLFMLIADGEISQLKKISSRYITYLSSVDPELLSQTATNLEEFVSSDLTLPQLLSLFSKIIETEDLKLKLLDICRSDLSEVPPTLLARAAVRLVSLIARSLNSEQVQEILLKIFEEKNNLRTKNLNIFTCSSIETVSPETLAAALI